MRLQTVDRAESREAIRPAVLVLGLGNPLLGDDGVGLALLAELARGQDAWGGSVEFIDGGTLGLGLLGHISGRRALIVLDAVKLGKAPGTVHVLREWKGAVPHPSTAHESNAAELLGIAALLGELPDHIRIIGIEPDRVAVEMGLSDDVINALSEALDEARVAIRELKP